MTGAGVLHGEYRDSKDGVLSHIAEHDTHHCDLIPCSVSSLESIVSLPACDSCSHCRDYLGLLNHLPLHCLSWIGL